VTLKRFRRSGRVASAINAEPTPTPDGDPGWEYLMLAHEIRDSVHAYHERYIAGQIHSSENAITSLEEAVRNVSVQSQVLKSIIGTFDRLLSPESMDSALGKPGEPGDPEKIRCLASEFGEAYGLLLAWTGEVRDTRVPREAQQLYISFSSYAARPLDQIGEFVKQLVSDIERAVSELRSGREPDHDIVVRLAPEIDPELIRDVEHELSKLVEDSTHQARRNAVAPYTSGSALADSSRRLGSSVPQEPLATTTFLQPADALAVGEKLGAGDFVAIDFETATRSRASACAVGLAFVTSGQISDVRRWLIRPPGNEYEGINISIHGITPKMTADSPEFIEIWPAVLQLLGGQPVVAHYAAFDMGVLRAALASAGQRWPTLTYLCTCVLSRNAWPGRLSYRLDDVAHACGIEFQHHEAGADASAAAQLGVAICGATGRASLVDASLELGVWPGELGEEDWTPCGIHSGGAHPKYSDLRPTVNDIPEDGELYGKTVLFTGALGYFTRDEAAQRAVNAGAHVTNSVSRKVDYLVCGMQDARVVKDGVHSTKMIAASELNNKGASIELLSEADFYRMLQS
jgi:DNA polymerase-3 subunit epsilon